MAIFHSFVLVDQRVIDIYPLDPFIAIGSLRLDA